jgi:hypothetical protein
MSAFSDLVDYIRARPALYAMTIDAAAHAAEKY